MANVIPDRLAKKLWLGTSLIAVSTIPLLQLTVVDYAHWNIDVANQTGQLIGRGLVRLRRFLACRVMHRLRMLRL